MQKDSNLLPQAAGDVLLLVDWENLWYSLLSRYSGRVEETHLEKRLEKMIAWLGGRRRLLGAELVGENLTEGHGFAFAPEHLNQIHREILTDQGFWLMTCPKKLLKEAREKPKSPGEMETRVDTVDQTIIDFTLMMTGHNDIKTVCLVSGDRDYIPLLEELGRRGIKRALVPPTVDSLARDVKITRLVDRDPKTNRKMIQWFDKF